MKFSPLIGAFFALSICIIKRKPDIFHPKNYAFVGLVRALVIFNCVWLPERQGK